MMMMAGLGVPELIVLLILGVIGIVIAIVIIKFVLGGDKACPHCAEKIKEAARVCRFCGRDVVSA